MLSITMPVYNVEKYLKKAIDSVLQQTYQDWELILVDDGSTDNSGRICDDYCRQDQRIHVIHKLNGGLVSARECAIKEAKGEYVCFLDSDDWVEPDMYEQMIAALEKTGADLCVGGYVHDYGTYCQNHFQQTAGFVMTREEFYINFLQYEHFGWELADKVYKTRIIKQTHVDDKILCGEDLARNWQVGNMIQQAVYIPLYKYHYYQRDGSSTSGKVHQYNKLPIYVFQTIEEMSPEFSSAVKELFLKKKFELSVTSLKSMQLSGSYSYQQINGVQKFIRSHWWYVFTKRRIPFPKRVGAVFYCLPYSACRCFFALLARYEAKRKKNFS